MKKFEAILANGLTIENFSWSMVESINYLENYYGSSVIKIELVIDKD